VTLKWAYVLVQSAIPDGFRKGLNDSALILNRCINCIHDIASYGRKTVDDELKSMKKKQAVFCFPILSHNLPVGAERKPKTS
jgi:hypothetical protein